MSSRRSIHSPRNVSGSRSPTASVINQSGSRSPQRVKIQNELSLEEDANEVESGQDEDFPNTTTSDRAYDSQQQIDYTTESVTPPPSPQQNRKNPQPQRTRSPAQRTENLENKPISNPNYKLIFYAIICVLPVLVCSQIYMKNQNQSDLKTCRFKGLRKQAPLQSPEVWDALQINIELLLNKRIKSPNIYLFLHSNEYSGGTIQKLIQNIALETSKCFDGQRPIEMSLQDFKAQNGDDYGYPIEQYKSKLKEGNVFLIVNLNDIPPSAARSLHTICETYSPIDPDVVIFLTLNTPLSTDIASPTGLAVQTLRELWKDLPDYELDALIARVTDQVLLLKG